MNRDQIEGNWKQFRGAIQQKWGKITNDDLDIAKGDMQVLIGKVQERYGKKREEAEREVNEWWDSVSQPVFGRTTTPSSSAYSDSEDEIVPTSEIDPRGSPERDGSNRTRTERNRDSSNLL